MSADLDRPVVIRDVVHAYPTFTLGPVDLDLEPDRVHGLLGPNGSGKTTLISLMTGFLRAQTGSLLVCGQQPRADGGPQLVDLGYAPDEDDLIPELSATEYWQVCATIVGRWGVDVGETLASAESLADRLGFVPPERLISGYSHGMRRKTQLVAALMHRPRLVILDEPTNGLDPMSAYALGGVLRDASADGATVVVASHDLAWAERFTDTTTMVMTGRVGRPTPTAQVLRPHPDATLLDGFMVAAESLAAGPQA